MQRAVVVIMSTIIFVVLFDFRIIFEVFGIRLIFGFVGFVVGILRNMGEVISGFFSLVLFSLQVVGNGSKIILGWGLRLRLFILLVGNLGIILDEEEVVKRISLGDKDVVVVLLVSEILLGLKFLDFYLGVCVLQLFSKIEVERFLFVIKEKVV